MVKKFFTVGLGSALVVAALLGAIIYLPKLGPYLRQTQLPAPGTEPKTSGLIQVNTPPSNAEVQSPLIVLGQARGSWYFEGSFPMKLVDGNGQELASSTAQAQGEWMTENFVPFRAELKFAPPATQNGSLILQKDNPSGLPENFLEYRIPVRFKN